MGNYSKPLPFQKELAADELSLKETFYFFSGIVHSWFSPLPTHSNCLHTSSNQDH